MTGLEFYQLLHCRSS